MPHTVGPAPELFALNGVTFVVDGRPVLDDITDHPADEAIAALADAEDIEPGDVIVEEELLEAFEEVLATLYTEYTPEYAAAESGVDAGVIREITELVAGAGTALSTHNWRSAAAGNLGGWQVSRTLFLVAALLGAVASPGGTHLNAWNKFVPKPMHVPGHPHQWNELTWPIEYPLAMNELSFILPHMMQEGRGTLDVYFSRVYNPVWTNPDGMVWTEVLRDEDDLLARRQLARQRHRRRAALRQRGEHALHHVAHVG